MKTLSRALAEGLLAACNIGRSDAHGFQVSVRRDRGDGWEVYFGQDLEETVGRAIVAGRQYLGEIDQPESLLTAHEDDDDNWSHLI